MATRMFRLLRTTDNYHVFEVDSLEHRITLHIPKDRIHPVNIEGYVTVNHIDPNETIRNEVDRLREENQNLNNKLREIQRLTK